MISNSFTTLKSHLLMKKEFCTMKKSCVIKITHNFRFARFGINNHRQKTNYPSISWPFSCMFVRFNTSLSKSNLRFHKQIGLNCFSIKSLGPDRPFGIIPGEIGFSDTKIAVICYSNQEFLDLWYTFTHF